MMWLRFCAYLLLGVLAGCGGGGGGGGSNNPPIDTPPPLNPNPNILLIISDDVGLDASSGYTIGTELPATPTLDALAANGLIFDNAWANPVCSPTRATILTGRYGYRTGVLAAGDDISLNETSLQSFIDTNIPNTYSHGAFGKWHLAGPENGEDDNPNLMGIDHFAGLPAGAGGANYYDWTLVRDGQSEEGFEYTTTAFADLAGDWIATQQQPWFAWLAFNAAHTPFHVPPRDLYDGDTLPENPEETADPLPYYLAAIEAMDHEIGLLLDRLSQEDRANTIVIYFGDNGTPRQVVQGHARNHGKGSVYEGGVAVPLIISGRGVTRVGARESGLVGSVDLFATIASLAGTNTEEFNDSKSFAHLLTEATASRREYAYAEIKSYDRVDRDDRDDWAIRNTRYKLIDRLGSGQELYDLEADPFEQNNRVNDIDLAATLIELQAQAALIRQ
jgi:arylsulfatase A-like enzyme